MEDEKIVQLYWDRDERAIPETAAKYGSYCTSIAQNILGSAEDAEECVNDTYLGAWNAIPPARPAHFFAFLAKLCRNLACNRLDWLNAAKRRADVVSLTDELAACVPGADGGREQALRELGGLLSDFLRGLPQ